MATEPPPPVLGTDAATAAPHASVAPQPSLAERHARALYRPVPPVGYDDEGHPESDSAAVESDTHEKLRRYAISALSIRYQESPGFYAASDMGLLFERGNPAAVMAPDLLVSLNAGRRARSSYKLWQEPVPDLVMELLSPRTWRRDVEAKPALYEALGVREFWLFDPIGRLPRPINGWRLDAGGAYAPVPALPDGAFRSTVLGLDLVAHGDGFRFRDPETGDLLPDPAEALRAERADHRETANALRETAEALRVAQARLAALRRQP
ncbi:MAG: Uma2 family endonuclease [Gammaproteobacteria bacterium]|nr:Uma2 family endonuclease [Gammaproteobacteria bacterium]MDE0441410.1 Uma2 family endonuclease [Gammaproteobacteria bacterium]